MTIKESSLYRFVVGLENHQLSDRLSTFKENLTYNLTKRWYFQILAISLCIGITAVFLYPDNYSSFPMFFLAHSLVAGIFFGFFIPLAFASIPLKESITLHSSLLSEHQKQFLSALTGLGMGAVGNITLSGTDYARSLLYCKICRHRNLKS